MSKADKENKVMHFTQRMDDLVKTWQLKNSALKIDQFNALSDTECTF